MPSKADPIPMSWDTNTKRNTMRLRFNQTLLALVGIVALTTIASPHVRQLMGRGGDTIVSPLSVTKVDSLVATGTIDSTGEVIARAGVRLTAPTTGPIFKSGTGSPNGSVTATQGSIFVRTDSAQVYQNTNGAMAWSQIGAGGVTSVTAADGLTATPNPITSTGTVSLDRTVTETVAYLAIGDNNNWTTTGLGTSPVLLVHANDDSGSVITGIDSTGIAVGFQFLLCNTGISADDGVIALPPNSSLSLANNRIWTPDYGKDVSQTATSRFIIGPSSCTGLIYMQPNQFDATVKRWMVIGADRFNSVVATQFGIYPEARPPAITSGATTNNWDPDDACPALNGGSGPSGNTCEAGANVKVTSRTMVWVSTTTASEAILGGIKYTGSSTADGIGPIKIICSAGPGPVRLQNSTVSTSDTINAFGLGPGGSLSDVVLAGSNACAAFWHIRDGGTWQPLWNSTRYISDRDVTMTKGLDVSANGTAIGVSVHSTNPATGGGVSLLSDSASAYTGYRLGRTLTDGVFGVAGGNNHYMNGTVAGDIVLSANGGTLFVGSVINGDAPIKVASSHAVIDGYTQITRTTDQSVTNGGLTNDDTLLFSTTAGKTYAVEFHLIVTGDSTTADGIFDLAVAAGTMKGRGSEISLDLADAIQTTAVTVAGAADTTDTTFGTAADIALPLNISGSFAFNASNSTTFRVRFGQSTPSVGQTVRMKVGSYIRYKLLD